MTARKYGRGRPFTKSRGRRATVAKPYGGSKYGNDCYIKVEKITQLATLGDAVPTEARD